MRTYTLYNSKLGTFRRLSEKQMKETKKFYGIDFEVFPSPETAEIESKDEFTLLESKIAEVNKIIAEGIETAQGKSAYEIAVENGGQSVL